MSQPASSTTPLERARPAGSLLAIHCLTSIPLTAMAAWLCSITMGHVLRFQPGYPRSVTLAVYTPLALGRWFHLLGPLGLAIILLAFLALTALFAWRGRPNLASATLVVHLLFLGVAFVAYALSANQLAGLAASLAGR